MLWQKLKEWRRKLHNRNNKDRRKMLRQKIKGWHRKLQNIKDKGRCNRLRQKLKGGSSDHDHRGNFKKRKGKCSVLRQKRKGRHFLIQRKKRVRRVREISLDRGGVGGWKFSRGAQPTPDFQNYRFGKLKLVNILYHLSTIFGN